MNLRISSRARDQLRQQLAYVAERNPSAAVRLADRVIAAIEGLAEGRRTGRPGTLPGTRELVVTGSALIIIYQMQPNQIEVLYIKHARQSYERLEEADLDDEDDIA
ncbi:MAG: type II toxin-antitoxin system RelE/ParE family toxin [Chloroflexaceae bacterium]|nr:type II toxin-antitoxin system RelE/ParE family toxin [Chloroflexaceae bacterium]